MLFLKSLLDSLSIPSLQAPATVSSSTITSERTSLSSLSSSSPPSVPEQNLEMSHQSKLVHSAMMEKYHRDVWNFIDTKTDLKVNWTQSRLAQHNLSYRLPHPPPPPPPRASLLFPDPNPNPYAPCFDPYFPNSGPSSSSSSSNQRGYMTNPNPMPPLLSFHMPGMSLRHMYGVPDLNDPFFGGLTEGLAARDRTGQGPTSTNTGRLDAPLEEMCRTLANVKGQLAGLGKSIDLDVQLAGSDSAANAEKIVGEISGKIAQLESLLILSRPEVTRLNTSLNRLLSSLSATSINSLSIRGVLAYLTTLSGHLRDHMPKLVALLDPNQLITMMVRLLRRFMLVFLPEFIGRGSCQPTEDTKALPMEYFNAICAILELVLGEKTCVKAVTRDSLHELMESMLPYWTLRLAYNHQDLPKFGDLFTTMDNILLRVTTKSLRSTTTSSQLPRLDIASVIIKLLYENARKQVQNPGVKYRKLYGQLLSGQLNIQKQYLVTFWPNAGGSVVNMDQLMLELFEPFEFYSEFKIQDDPCGLEAVKSIIDSIAYSHASRLPEHLHLIQAQLKDQPAESTALYSYLKKTFGIVPKQIVPKRAPKSVPKSVPESVPKSVPGGLLAPAFPNHVAGYGPGECGRNERFYNTIKAPKLAAATEGVVRVNNRQVDIMADDGSVASLPDSDSDSDSDSVPAPAPVPVSAFALASALASASASASASAPSTSSVTAPKLTTTIDPTPQEPRPSTSGKRIFEETISPSKNPGCSPQDPILIDLDDEDQSQQGENDDQTSAKKQKSTVDDEDVIDLEPSESDEAEPKNPEPVPSTSGLSTQPEPPTLSDSSAGPSTSEPVEPIPAVEPMEQSIPEPEAKEPENKMPSKMELVKQVHEMQQALIKSQQMITVLLQGMTEKGNDDQPKKD